MHICAQHRNARMSAQKMRAVRSVVRGLPVAEAENQLTFLPGKAAAIVKKVLLSAVANAVHNHEADREKLTVADVIVDAGLTMKRFNPVSRGMAHGIKKRTCHVTVVVDDGLEKAKTKKKKAKKADIKTLSVAEAVKQEAEAAAEEAEKDTADEAEPTTPAKRPASKKEQVHSKIKTMQQGGDKAKTHRRKSMSDS